MVVLKQNTRMASSSVAPLTETATGTEPYAVLGVALTQPTNLDDIAITVVVCAPILTGEL